MDKVIHQHGGFINNYMGDGLMALFGVNHPEDAVLNAVKAALDMLEEVEKLKPYLVSLCLITPKKVLDHRDQRRDTKTSAVIMLTI